MLLAVLVVLLLLTVSFIPLGAQRPVQQRRFDTAPPQEVPGRDSDLDGLSDKQERALGTNPYDPDSDHDRIGDGDEYSYYQTRQERGMNGEVGTKGLSKWLAENFGTVAGLNRTAPLGDAEGDGLPNLRDRDSDGDVIPDGIEIASGLDPLDPDTDQDGAKDDIDRSPLSNKDSDGDGVSDDLDYYLKSSSHDSAKETLDPLDRPDQKTMNDILFYVDPETEPRYWRLKAYDFFDGSEWSRTAPAAHPYSGSAVGTGVASDIAGHEVTYKVTFNGSTIGFLPTALYTTRISNMVPFGSALYRDNYGGFLTKGDRAQAYNFSAFVYDFTEERLNTSKAGNDTSFSLYLQQPSNVSGRVRALAAELGKRADTPYDKAVVIADYLRENFRFDFNAPSPTESERRDLVDWFLFEARQGRSPEFATALVVLLRLNNIPARIAEGYALGDIVDGRRAVRNGHAHSWGEVYLYGVGWIALESTGTTVSPNGASGVDSDGGDPNVNQGSGAGTGGGTTSKDPSGKITNVTTVGSITLRADRDPVWKGDLFHVSGSVDGAGFPPRMEMTIYLQSFNETTGVKTGQMVVAGRGLAHGGKFDVLCSPDKTPVGKNVVIASAEGNANGTLVLASRPNGALNITVKSSSGFGVDAPAVFLKDSPVNIRFSLIDVGGLGYAGKDVNVSWANRSWTVRTQGATTEVTFNVTEPVGHYPLVLSFNGDYFLSGAYWTREFEVNDTRTLLSASLDPPSPVVTVGDSRSVLVTLTTSGGLLINEEVGIYMDTVKLASGMPNGLPLTVTFLQDRVSAGEHQLIVLYNGTAEHPKASVWFDLKIVGKTRIVLAQKRVTLGEKMVLTPRLVDNLNRPLSDQPMEITWQLPSGNGGHVSGKTDTEGKVDLVMDTLGEDPGRVEFSLTYAGSPYYLGTFTLAEILLSSPTVLTAEFPPMLVREREFAIHGRLFDRKGHGQPAQRITISYNGSDFGDVKTMADGSFLFTAEPSLLVPLGKATLTARFDGNDTLDPGYNVSRLFVYALPHVRIDGPDVVDTGREYKYSVTLIDDRGNPLAGRPLTVIATGSRSKQVVTDASGKATFKVKPAGGLMMINATFVGEGFFLPASGLKRAEVTIWGLLEVLLAVIIALAVIMAVANHLFNRRQLKDAETAIARAEGVKVTDKHRRAIYRIYKAMSRLFEKHGAERARGQTVREYETDVPGRLPVDVKGLGAVTDVFEEARYSDHSLAQGHVDLARKGYDRIDRRLKRDRPAK